MNRISKRLRVILAAPRQSDDEKLKKDPNQIADYSDLSNPKNMERYEKNLNSMGSNFDDETGKVKDDPITNRMLQDTAFVEKGIQTWLSDCDAVDYPLEVPSDIMNIQVGDQTVKDMADSDDTKITLDSPKRPNNVISPYKIVGQLCNEKAGILQQAEHAILQERVELEDRIDYLTQSKAINFMATYFGGGSKTEGEKLCRIRRQHYRMLSNAWDAGLKDINSRASKMASELAKVFEDININGQEYYGSDVFDHIKTKGDQFIKTLKLMAVDAAQGKPVNRATQTGPAANIYHYLENSILKGDNLGVISKRIEKKTLFRIKLANVLDQFIRPNTEYKTFDANTAQTFVDDFVKQNKLIEALKPTGIESVKKMLAENEIDFDKLELYLGPWYAVEFSKLIQK